MKKLYIIQHGLAMTSEEDLDRPLTKKGVLQTEQIGNFLSENHIKVDMLCHSPKLRSKQTAQILKGIINPEADLVENEDVNPNSDPAQFVQFVKAQDEDILIAGHMPHLARLVGILLTQNIKADIIRVSNSSVICLQQTGEGWILLFSVPNHLVSQN